MAERFDRALKAIRSALTEMDLEIVGEFDTAELLHNSAPRGASSRTILVDSPLLNFEALALDRAAAVFFPLHVLVSAAGERTEISIIDFTRLLDARLPVGATDPMDRLVGRVELALESVALRPEV